MMREKNGEYNGAKKNSNNLGKTKGGKKEGQIRGAVTLPIS